MPSHLGHVDVTRVSDRAFSLKFTGHNCAPLKSRIRRLSLLERGAGFPKPCTRCWRPLFQIWVSVSWISDNWIDYLVTQIKSELTPGRVCVYEAGCVIGCVKVRTKWKNLGGSARLLASCRGPEASVSPLLKWGFLFHLLSRKVRFERHSVWESLPSVETSEGIWHVGTETPKMWGCGKDQMSLSTWKETGCSLPPQPRPPPPNFFLPETLAGACPPSCPTSWPAREV